MVDKLPIAEVKLDGCMEPPKVFYNFLQEQTALPPNKLVRELNSFVDQIQTYLGNSAHCELILGGIVEHGLEYRCVLSCRKLDFAQYLFHAYLSLDGKQMAFRQPNQKIEKNVKNLHKRLVKLLNRTCVGETIQYLKSTTT